MAKEYSARKTYFQTVGQHICLFLESFRVVAGIVKGLEGVHDIARLQVVIPNFVVSSSTQKNER